MIKSKVPRSQKYIDVTVTGTTLRLNLLFALENLTSVIIHIMVHTSELFSLNPSYVPIFFCLNQLISIYKSHAKFEQRLDFSRGNQNMQHDI